ncbi:hypothetical protein IVG45_20420 [Methylomonas sp. LL1]|uniref:hypothetical protein n=1 Tax=Methylomonas sp. LL1 TaxID=2785785 RepID=UPI0018C40F4A|nr:hypothetical protein [Methylomonas sp. LL1]QPK63140.1 hypothetical protein IVG45_20420 [Methylomonas sp. LL1]
MVDSVSSGNAAGLITALMSEVAAKQNLQVGLVKKAQDVEKMQGEAALKLIEAAGNVADAGKIDVRA